MLFMGVIRVRLVRVGWLCLVWLVGLVVKFRLVLLIWIVSGLVVGDSCGVVVRLGYWV